MTSFALPFHTEELTHDRRRAPSRLMNGEQTELDGLRALDPQVLSTIHNRYFPEVFRYARYRLGDEILAEDIAGEVFTRLLEANRAGRGPKTTLRGWLLGTAANLVNDHLRQVYSRPRAELPDGVELHSDEPGPVHLVEQTERQQEMRSALAKLTAEQQQVVALRFGAEYSLEETASIMNKNVNAIKALQFRALAALRRLFTEELL